MNWTANDDSITRQSLSIRDTISELHAITRLPAAWFSDLIEIKNKAVVSFFKTGLYNKNYQRNIEKQLIVTTGINYCFFYCIFFFIDNNIICHNHEFIG